MTLVALLACAGPLATAVAQTSSSATLTVWVEGAAGADLAERISARHAEMAAKGYRFLDIELYADKGSVRGALVTYIRGSP
jgi:hypothetical protein